MQESFGRLEMSARLRRDSALMKAHALIDWEGLRALLTGLYKREASRAGGQAPFDALLMSKATLLGQWHSLSDPKLEYALTVRIDFIHFCGLTLSEAAPDESTLCRFRNRLIEAGRLAPLLAAVTETLSVDPDATWLKKGKTSHFGFSAYATVDSDDGFVRGVHTAPANQSETTHFEAAVKRADFTPCRTHADKGFASAANRKHLRGKGTKSAIMHKAQRNRPLSQRQRNANKAISKTRYTVEQCFGTMKRLFGMARASYLGAEKLNASSHSKRCASTCSKRPTKVV
jgi:transposase, IS5 family